MVNVVSHIWLLDFIGFIYQTLPYNNISYGYHLLAYVISIHQSQSDYIMWLSMYLSLLTMLFRVKKCWSGRTWILFMDNWENGWSCWWTKVAGKDRCFRTRLLNKQIDKASSCGLVVKAEDLRLRGSGFKLQTEETILQAPFIWIKSLEQKLSGNQPGIVAYAVILQKGGWTLRMVGLLNPAS